MPSLEVAQSFVVMSLNAGGDELYERHGMGLKFNAVTEAVGADDATEIQTCFDRLGLLVDEEPGTLMDQVREVRPLAKKLYDMEGEMVHNAWSRAFVSKRKNASKNL